LATGRASHVWHILERLKTDIRNWAKKSYILDLSWTQIVQIPNILDMLPKVVLLNGSELPGGFPIYKAASLLLNALVAQDLYVGIISDPFFFQEGIAKDEQQYPKEILNQVYMSILSSD
jgi:hypothetical protein